MSSRVRNRAAIGDTALPLPCGGDSGDFVPSGGDSGVFVPRGGDSGVFVPRGGDSGVFVIPASSSGCLPSLVCPITARAPPPIPFSPTDEFACS
jgi:hypothetical protein